MAPTMPQKKGKKTKVSTKKPQKIEVSDDDRLPGVVYIGHIPHGFYERQINEYFSQFGKVLEIKLSRSKKNGNAKGYAFVKFQYAAVAKTVAETCHNYLFFNKLLKCEYKPLSDIHPDTFFRYHMKPNTKPKRLHNQGQTQEKVVSSFTEMLGKQKKKMNKLQKLGINLDLDDVAEINKSRLPSEKTAQPSTKKIEVDSSETETTKKPPTKTNKSKKTEDKTVEVSTPQTKIAQPAVRKSSKRKADAIEEDMETPLSPETKISPAAKRLKRTVKSRTSSPSQTKTNPSPKKAMARNGRKK